MKTNKGALFKESSVVGLERLPFERKPLIKSGGFGIVASYCVIVTFSFFFVGLFFNSVLWNMFTEMKKLSDYVKSKVLYFAISNQFMYISPAKCNYIAHFSGLFPIPFRLFKHYDRLSALRNIYSGCNSKLENKFFCWIFCLLHLFSSPVHGVLMMSFSRMVPI